MKKNSLCRVVLLLAATTLLAACFGAPVVPAGPAAPVVPHVAPEQRLAAVMATGGVDDRELAVQPLRDPEVEDLRITATRAMAARDYASAADALNQALLSVADDPAILQERAEVALLQSDFARAETLSQHALELGSKVGPLCRRHWATVEQARLALGQMESAAAAHAQIETCTVAGLLRM